MSTQETNEPLKLSRESIQRITEKMVDVVIKEIEDQRAADMAKAVDNAKPKWEWWHPKKGEKYWYLDSCGLRCSEQWMDVDYDIYRRSNCNVFRTKNDLAEFADLGKFQRKWAMILKELNPKGWKPDWTNMHSKWHPAMLSDGADEPIPTGTAIQYTYGSLYAESKDICLRAIELMGDDIYHMFGVPIHGW